MSEFVKKTRKYFTPALAMLALAGCAEATAERDALDKGTRNILPCPAGYPSGEAAQITNYGDIHRKINRAIIVLAGKMPKDLRNQGSNYPDRSQFNLQQKAYIEAGQKVFYVGADAFSEYLNIKDTETKLDDPSEQFCTSGGKLYVSPQASQALDAIEMAGIDTKIANL